jgi:glycosyltransferase involved in cell wall biosynthesis
MKKEEIKFSKTIENLCCNYEKLRIFIKLARMVPNKRDMINRTKKHMRIHLPEFLNNEILFNGCGESFANEVLLSLVRGKTGAKKKEGAEFASRYLVVSHEMSRTGAPKAALMLAQTLKRIAPASHVCVLTLKDGPMRSEFEAAGICVLSLEEVPYRRPVFLEFVHDFDVVFVCSVAWEFLRIIRDVKIPVTWWVHEIIITPAAVQMTKEFINHIDLLLAGSPVVTAPFLDNFKRDMQMLLYGLPPIRLPTRKFQSETVTFALLGSVCERKGTDLFISAIELLPDDIRKQAHFVVIGDNDDEKIYHKLTQAADRFDELEIYGNMPFDELIRFYAGFDVVVSASREDPMPIVLTYAFMFSKLCLCSDAVGTALLIEDGKDGILFQKENPSDLGCKIKYIIENREKCNEMAQNGRNVYQEHFSMDKFEENIRKITSQLADCRQGFAK